MANTILTPDVVAREALLILKNNTVTASLVYRDYETEWSGAKINDTVKIRRPATFVANEFVSTINVQDIDEGSVELKLSDVANLSAGDVIILDQPASQPLIGTIDDRPMFRVWPGKIGSRRACQIAPE